MAALHKLLVNPLFVLAAFLGLALALYGNTLGHQYALDDAIVITQNSYTQEGVGGLGKIFTSDAFEAFFKGKRDLVAGGRYRPLSIATFALEYQVFGANPFVSHLVNVVLYGLLGWLIFMALRSLLVIDPAKDRNRTLFAFLVTVVFMAHPIHTEVVANIKGRDELLAMLFSMGGLWAILEFGRSGKTWLLGLALPAFFLGAMSKETALPFLAVVPLSLWVQGSRDVAKLAMATASVFVGLLLYILLRVQYAGLFSTVESTEILNDPFFGSTFMEQAATAAKTLVIYFGKLIVPAKLSHDYYFNQVPVVGWSDPTALLGLAMALGSMVFGGMLLVRKELAGYGILFFFLTFSIVSNLVFPIGTTMGERFMFVPSLGFILAFFAGLERLLAYLKMDVFKSMTYFALAVTVIFGIRTVVRNPVWENDFVLFTTDVENSPNSAKMQTAAGGALMDEAVKPGNESKKAKYLAESVVHLRKAVEIYPQHGTAWLIMGNAYFNQGLYKDALEAYKQVLIYRPGMNEAYKNAALAATNAKDFRTAESYFATYLKAKPDDMDAMLRRGDNFEAAGQAQAAIDAYGEILKKNPKDNIALGKIGMVYGKLLQNYDMAISYLSQALALNPKEEMHHENIGIAYAMKGDTQKALESFNRGLEYFPNSPKMLRNIGITYINMGDSVKGKEFIARAGG
jgi:tetratricopeptide (TPR) repeat protein